MTKTKLVPAMIILAIAAAGPWRRGFWDHAHLVHEFRALSVN
jgi:hypothetical protein